MPEDTKPTTIDLFAGAGGTGLGFVRAGFRLVGAVESDRSCADTYERNLRVSVVDQDIRILVPARFRTEIGLAVGQLDVLIGCPPCQGFSIMRGGSGASDKRNELVLQYLEFVAAFRPRFGVFENVPGLIRSPHGAEFYERLYSGLRSLGYGVTERLVDAADFGVPQHRRRVIVMIGRDGRVPAFPWPTHDSPIAFSVTGGFRLPWRTVRDAIGHYPPPAPSGVLPPSAAVPNHIEPRISPKVLAFIEQVPRNGGSRTDVPRDSWLDCHMRHAGHKDVYGRAAWDGPSNTITAGCTNPSKGRFVHPEQNRSFTVREAAALQGFPDDYVFLGSKQSVQVGNAVPPPLAHCIASTLLELLDG